MKILYYVIFVLRKRFLVFIKIYCFKTDWKRIINLKVSSHRFKEVPSHRFKGWSWSWEIFIKIGHSKDLIENWVKSWMLNKLDATILNWKFLPLGPLPWPTEVFRNGHWFLARFSSLSRTQMLWRRTIWQSRSHKTSSKHRSRAWLSEIKTQNVLN